MLKGARPFHHPDHQPRDDAYDNLNRKYYKNVNINKEIDNINNHFLTIKQKIINNNDKILLTECISSDNITCVDNIIGYGVVKVTDKIIQMVTKD